MYQIHIDMGHISDGNTRKYFSVVEYDGFYIKVVYFVVGKSFLVITGDTDPESGSNYDFTCAAFDLSHVLLQYDSA